MEAIASLRRRHSLLVSLLKAAIALLLLVVLYFQIISREHLAAIEQAFWQNLYRTNLSWLLLAIALMPVNWAFETLKWRQFTKPFSNFTFWQTYRAVLGGVAVSLITPNRIGDFGGRVLLSERRHAWRIVLATLLGSFSQLIVLFSCGIVGFLWFLYNHLEWKMYLFMVVAGAGVAIVVSLTILFFRIRIVLPLLKKLLNATRWKRVRKQIVMLRTVSDPQRWTALGWALMRYLTYSLQYWLLLNFLGIYIPVGAAFAAIATIFLLQTGIPLPPIGALLARAEIALWVWEHFKANEISVLAATFGLFIINLVLPALLGTIFIVTTNIKKLSGYEKIAV